MAVHDLRGEIIFIGGTALTRTVLPGLRLSDLIVSGDRGRDRVASELQAIVTRAVRRSHGRLRWEPDLSATRHAEPATVVTGDGIRVQIQLLDRIGYPRWPTRLATIEQRYSDVGAAELYSLTTDAFVASKTSTWLERRAPRDLYDLWALASAGLIGAGAAQLYRRIGPTGLTPTSTTFGSPPSSEAWRAALAHQCELKIGPHHAHRVVLTAWESAINSLSDG